jgi:hypothetical protein
LRMAARRSTLPGALRGRSHIGWLNEMTNDKISNPNGGVTTETSRRPPRRWQRKDLLGVCASPHAGGPPRTGHLGMKL